MSDNRTTALNRNRRSGKRIPSVRSIFWVGIAILAILLVMSIIVLSACIIQHAQADRRAVLIRSSMDSELDIFSIYYKNDDGEITVCGLDGNKVIAPGTDVEYTLRIRNADTCALDYVLMSGIELTSEHELPILVRVLDPEDAYIIGSAKEWVPISSLHELEMQGTLSAGQAVEYTFQWMWRYEGGDDEYDTMLGNLEDGAGIEMSLTLSALENTDVALNGGFLATDVGRIIALIIVALLLLIAIVLLIASIIRRAKTPPTLPTPTPAPTPVIEPEPVVEPEPAPAVVPTPVARQKKEGFWGKMAYVNIDVICHSFSEGEVVSLAALKRKGLLPEGTKQMKVLARNAYKLEFPITVRTQGISSEARRIILEAGGEVIITDGAEDLEN